MSNAPLAVGQVFEVSQPRLDLLVDALGLNAGHRVSFIGEPTGDEREEVSALARGPNRFEHFSYENGDDTPTSDELVAIRDNFSG